MTAVTPLRGLAGVPDLAGDYLNARRFLDAHRGHVIRSPELGRWFIWNGNWFEEDRLDQMLELAAEIIDQLRSWVGQADTADEFKRRSRHYEASSKAGRRDALLGVAGTDPDVVVGVGQLDSHPYLLPCRNGTVDLRTGHLTSPDPHLLLTHGVDVEYDPDAQSELWEQVIDQIFDRDEELIGFVQRLFGYCMTGIVHEHVLPVLWGGGANGKSTLVKVLQSTLGQLAITAPEGLVIRQDREPHPERFAALRGKRLAVSNELEAKAALAEQTVKSLTGGDTLSARELYGRRFNFEPTHKVLLVTNHRPRVAGRDNAMWRRLRLVPFAVTIPPERQDPDLARRLIEEHGPAVLTWLVQGAMEWHRTGLGDAEAVTDATEDYRQSQDMVSSFLAECTVEVPGQKTKVGDLYNEWRRWCETAGERPGRRQDFAAALDETSLNVTTYQGFKFVRDLGIRLVGEDS
jgi:putative DNA primase/helicase